MIDRSTTNWGKRVADLGYALKSGYRDSLGRVWRFSAFPVAGGTIGHFSRLSDLTEWVRQVEITRLLTVWTDEYFAAIPASFFRGYPGRDRGERANR